MNPIEIIALVAYAVIILFLLNIAYMAIFNKDNH